jgi:hypothetical protein
MVLESAWQKTNLNKYWIAKNKVLSFFSYPQTRLNLLAGDHHTTTTYGTGAERI